MQISLYNDQLHDAGQAKEYELLANKLASGKHDEVSAHLKAVSDILKQQANMEGSEQWSIADFILPTSALSLVRDYEARRLRAVSRDAEHGSAR